jgi:eukaryotic-like serine/threonine-protein kinase
MSDTVGHYSIRQKLGSGGMGDVYLAEDTRLHRLVALKLLPRDVASDPQRRTRFIQEAHAASVLNHPNVSTIYEVGEDADSVFIAMEYIEGKTLSQLREERTPAVDEVIDIALQAADALDEAQTRGIVHRDIKSANLMITPRGHVKVLDFGLAKVSASELNAGDESTRIKTSPGMVMGTPYYMSPEQALGRTMDHRSDLFSLGVVLYELVTGRLPFAAATTTETIQKIMHAEPDPIARFNYGLPVELERIIRKLLEKDAGRRYQTARELVVDLKNLKRDTTSGELSASRAAAAAPRSKRALPFVAAAVAILAAIVLVVMRPWDRAGSAAADTIDSIAVLPFVNTSRDADTEYLSDGISESIINDLSRISGLRVVPRSTVFQFKGKDHDLQKIAESLKVRAIVAGRVLQRGDMLSVQAELVDMRSNAQLWGDRYERNVADALGMQEEISRQIAERLRGTAAPASEAMTRDPEAYQLYLKGRFHWNKRTGESVVKALGYFEQAVVRDPQFALAHVGVADSYVVMEQYAERDAPETTAKAEEAVRKALAADPTLAEAHTSKAMIHSQRREWAEAEKGFKRAIELKPSYPTTRHWYNIYLRQHGRMDEALVQVRKAQELDPLSMIIGVNVADVLSMMGRNDEAIRTAEKYLEIDPTYPQALGAVAVLYARVGRHQEAIAAGQKAVTYSGEVTEQLSNLASAHLIAGDRAGAMPIVQRIEERVARGQADPYYLAIVASQLGQKDRAFNALQQAVERGSGSVTFMKADFRLDALKTDPRYNDILRQLGLPV